MTNAQPQLECVEVETGPGMVVAGNREAADAGASILAAGGNAVDAAVAAGFVLSATEVDTAGLGGAAVVLMVGPTGLGTVVGGPPVVPLLFDRAEIERLHGADNPWGYATVAVPTTAAVLGYLHRRFGTMPWADIVAPAVEWAKVGGEVTPLSRAAAEAYRDRLAEQPMVADLFLDHDGMPRAVGSRRPNPRLAETLRQLGVEGIESFYRGTLAAAIDADMKARGGPVRRADLMRVPIRETAPVRGRYRGLEVLAAAPPFGGAEVVRALEILDAIPEERLRTDGPDRYHALVEAVRIALAQRGRSAQARPAGLPGANGSDSAAALARRIRFDRALRDDEIADELAAKAAGGTTHLVVADRWGRVVSMSMSIGLNFGAARMNEELGFLYNNFAGWTEAGRPEAPPTPIAGSALRSAMTPVVIRRKDGWLLALGSAGSDRIPSSSAAVVSAVVDRGLGLPAAVSAPRVLWGGPVDKRVYLEISTRKLESWADVLESRGFTDLYRQYFPARPFDLAAFGGTNAVAAVPEGAGWIGVADPRRGGASRAVGGRTDRVTGTGPVPDAHVRVPRSRARDGVEGRVSRASRPDTGVGDGTNET
jgi:gamma-glutamyltranspeptidase/glutathione hydrolase